MEKGKWKMENVKGKMERWRGITASASSKFIYLIEMQKTVVFVILMFVKISCFTQVKTLMQSLNGKDIGFKYMYNAVAADYQTDSGSFVTKNGKTINLEFANGPFYGYKFVKNKIDFYSNKTDTLVYTYSFYKEMLYKIHIYSNSHSINKILAQKLYTFSKIVVSVTKRKESVEKKRIRQKYTETRIAADHTYDEAKNESNLNITLYYARAVPYLPTWCGTGMKRNRYKKLERILSRN